jgi:hypothetical protein
MMVEITINSYGTPNNTYGSTTLPPLESGILNTIMDERYPDQTKRDAFVNPTLGGNRYSKAYDLSSVGTSSFYLNYEQTYCNKYVAHLTQDNTVDYFNKFKANYDYSTILYSGTKRSIGHPTMGIKADQTEEPDANFRGYKMAFLPDHSELRTVAGATYNMRGKFKDAASLKTQNARPSGVQVFKDFKFKASIDGVSLPISKDVDTEYFGIKGSVTKKIYTTKKMAIDAGDLFDIDITQRGSVVNKDFFDPNITDKNNKNRGQKPSDDFIPPSDPSEDPDSTTPAPTTAPPTTTATPTTAGPTTTSPPTGNTTAPPPTAPAPPSHSPPTTNPPPNVSC